MSTQPQSEPPQPGARHRLEPERRGITHRFNIAGHRGYITVGLYPSGQPGEIFLRMAKSGSTLSGLLDSLSIAVSLGLQSGIPLQAFADKYIDSRFDPLGFTGNPDIPEALSITDYAFRWLIKKFPAGKIQ